MSDVILIIFSNSEQNKLDWLYEEYKALEQLLSTHFRNRDTEVILVPFATLDDLILLLTKNRKRIIAFHFSGHAGRDRLILEDEIALGKGVADLLSTCPKLDLVVLNGCSTREQVDYIYNKRYYSYPIIISTSAAVNDKTAMKFSRQFWSRLCEGDPYQEAFDVTIAGLKIEKEIIINRSLALDSDENIKNLWGVFTKDKEKLDEQLPDGNVIVNTSHLVNEKLREILLQAYAPLDEAVHKALHMDIDTMDEATKSKERIFDEFGVKNYQLTKIVEALPHPISEQLRKLLSRPGSQRERNDYDFFDNLNELRLKQITVAYLALIETIAYGHIAQLWNDVLDGRLSPNEIPNELKDFFEFEGTQRREYAYLDLIGAINRVYLKNKQLTSFFPDWNIVGGPLDKDGELRVSINFMIGLIKQLKGKGYAAAMATQKCIEAETHLAQIYAKCAFIIEYKMISVRSIEVIRSRHSNISFNHNLVVLEQKLIGRLDEAPRQIALGFDEAKYNAAVIMENKYSESIILTPFVIDINAFEGEDNDEKLKDYKVFPNIYHFVSFQEIDKEDNYKFYRVYKPGDRKVYIKSQKYYKVIKEQFDNFKKVVLQIN